MQYTVFMHEISSYVCKAVQYGAFKTATSQLDLVINESGIISDKSYHLFMDLLVAQTDKS